MAENKMVSFNLPSPYQAELAKIADQQRMAEMLQAQSQAPTERYSYKGIEAQTPITAGLAKALQGFGGAYFEGQGREQEKALGEKYRKESSDILREAFKAGEGSAAVPTANVPQSSFLPSGSDLTDLTPPQRVPEGQPGEGNVVQDAYTVPGKAAVAPNQQRMAELLMSSPNPAHEALGLQTAQKAMEAKRIAAVMANLGVGSPQATPSQAMAAEGVSGGAPGPTNAAAARIGISNAGIPGVSPVATALMLDPSSHLNEIGKAAQTAFAEQSKSIVGRENAPILKRNPQTGVLEVEFSPAPKLPEGMNYNFKTGTVGVAQGFPESLSTITKTKGAAEGENVIETIEIGGRKVSGTRAQIKAILTGQAPNNDVAQSSVNIASQSGVPTNIKVNPTAAEAEYDKKKAESFAQMAEQMRASWVNSTRMNSMLDQLETLYKDPNVTQGALAENITGLKGIAASLNIDIAGKGSEDAIRSITNKFALELRNPSGGAGMPGAMSDSDRNFLASIPPSLSNTPTGRALISQGMRSINNRDKQIANMAQRYEEKNGRLDNGFVKEMREWSEKTPMFDEKQKAIMAELIKRGG